MNVNIATAKKMTPSTKIMHSKTSAMKRSIDFPPHSFYVSIINILKVRIKE